MKRQFYTRHPDTNKPIRVVQGESGYRPVTPVEGNNDIEKSLLKLNAFFNNTSKDLEIAISCSMFGWDIPYANELSKREVCSYDDL